MVLLLAQGKTDRKAVCFENQLAEVLGNAASNLPKKFISEPREERLEWDVSGTKKNIYESRSLKWKFNDYEYNEDNANGGSGILANFDFSLPKQIFTEMKFSLEFAFCTTYKEKKQVKDAITKNGGSISYIVTNNCNFHIVSTRGLINSSRKTAHAMKLRIPVVESSFIFACCQQQKLLDHFDFELGGVKEQLATGKIRGIHIGKQNLTQPGGLGLGRKRKKQPVAKFADQHLVTQDLFDRNFFVLKWFSCKVSENGLETLYIVEAHKFISKQGCFRLGIYRRKGVLYVDSVEKLSCLFIEYCENLLKVHHCERLWLPPVGLGSCGLVQILTELKEATEEADESEEVTKFLEWIWSDAVDEINSLLSSGSLEAITLKQIIEGESWLAEIKNSIISDGLNRDNLAEFSHKFCETLKLKEFVLISTLKDVASYYDFCQVVRDIVTVSEATNWNLRCPTSAKYRALRCHLEIVNPSEYQHILPLIGTGNLCIHRVFQVGRFVESACFEEKLGNIQLLFHGSRPSNVVGILSRGLLLPQIAISERGIERTDVGNLGNGLYFSDNFWTSIVYGSCGMVTGRRTMLVCDVALGDVFQTTVPHLGWVKPPEGYDSVHALPKSQNETSEFKDSEFAVYRVTQQKLRYLIEYSLPEDLERGNHGEKLPFQSIGDPEKTASEITSNEETCSIDVIKSAEKPIEKIQAGLQGEDSRCLPLSSLHVRASLVDLAADVVIIQQYTNDNSEEIEAKYVFPLDEGSIVCGFEAFINDKHVIGRVEEKRKARKQYKEAVEKGHGAYLMEEEASNVFTVSVGNLPAYSNVLIKIRYVTQMLFEDEDMSFRLPSAVAPWVKIQALLGSGETQKTTRTAVVGSEAPKNTSLQISISMPSDIRSIACSSHPVKIKKTASVAVVELCPSVPLDNNFHLLISLAEVHVPRLWIEHHPHNFTQAAMLVFYPEFDAEADDFCEIIIVLDMSNSMRGQSSKTAKSCALLLLHLLEESQQHVLFNVIVFGTGYKELFLQSTELTKSSFLQAYFFIENSTPSMGNTELYSLLRAISLTDNNSETNIILFSDGHINNCDVVLKMLPDMERLRIFSMQCSDTADTHTLRLLSKVSNGWFDNLETNRKSTWKEKLLKQFERCRQRCLGDVYVEWAVDEETKRQIEVAPRTLSSLFSGERKVAFALMPQGIENLRATLKASLGSFHVSTTVASVETASSCGQTLHRLAVKAIIDDWEEGRLAEESVAEAVLKRQKKDSIVELSKQYAVLSSLTSFVAVEERQEGEQLQRTKPDIRSILDAENVDILPYMGWQIDPTLKLLDLENEIDYLLRNSEVMKFTSMVSAQDNIETANSLCRGLPLAHPKRLKAALLLAHIYLAQNCQGKAINVVKEAIDGPFTELDTLDEDSYADCAKMLQDMENLLQEAAVEQPKTVSVKTLAGKTITLNAGDDNLVTVKDLKKSIEKREGVPLDQQRIVFGGRELNDDCTLNESGMEDMATANLVLRLRGGPQRKEEFVAEKEEQLFVGDKDKGEDVSGSDSYVGVAGDSSRSRSRSSSPASSSDSYVGVVEDLKPFCAEQAVSPEPEAVQSLEATEGSTSPESDDIHKGIAMMGAPKQLAIPEGTSSEYQKAPRVQYQRNAECNTSSAIPMQYQTIPENRRAPRVQYQRAPEFQHYITFSDRNHP